MKGNNKWNYTNKSYQHLHWKVKVDSFMVIGICR